MLVEPIDSRERAYIRSSTWNNPILQREVWGIPKLYEWQELIFRWLFGGIGRRLALSTPNESGKTKVIVPLAGLGVMSAWPGATVYSTSGSEAQIKLQLFEYLKSYCKPYEKHGWEVNTSALTVTGPAVSGLPASKWIGRVPRDALTAEGYHERWEVDDKGRRRFCPLLMIADEAKSLEDPVFDMMMRLRPTWVLVLSTPDVDSGPFYRAMNPEVVMARGVERLGYKYMEGGGYWGMRMMVFQDGCPHLMTEGKRRESEEVRMHSGEESKLYRSMVKGLFTSGEGIDKLYGTRDVENVLRAMGREITPEMYDGEAHAGFDVSTTGEGDEKILYILKGRVVLPAYKTREDDTVKVAAWAVDLLRKHGVSPRNCRVDNGGAGKVIVDIMETVFGYRGIDRYMNNAAATYKADYFDRITEDSYGVKNLLARAEIVLPKDERLLEDIKTRRVVGDDHGRVWLQKKRDHKRANNWKSPDYLDTLTMCLAGLVRPGLLAFMPPPKQKSPEYDNQRIRMRHYPDRTGMSRSKRYGDWGIKVGKLSDYLRQGKR